MVAYKNIIIFLVLSTLLSICLAQTQQGEPNQPQGGPHQNQGRKRRQVEIAEDVNDLSGIALNPLNWTTCDVTVIPKVSCHDCHTRVICKPVGGLLKSCNNPYRPYCNSGVCSAVPSPACV